MSDEPVVALRLGVIVPARNEALVIERKLRNLARVRWPAGEHRLVVVDDESSDGTGELARRLCGELFAGPRRDGAIVCAAVVANDVHPGKAGAIGRSLRELGDSADITVLTDADVVIDGEALVELERAFRLEPGLGMACGAQSFMLVLPNDGSWPPEELATRDDAAGLYDRITSLVRRVESRSGRLFSVHGQLLAWRADPFVVPTIGIAADDLDLMIQVRRKGRRIRLIEGARFFEHKTPPGARREEQALRRARAYVQVVTSHRRPFRGSLLGEAQWALYRWVPLGLPVAVRLLWIVAVLAVITADERRWETALLCVTVMLLWAAPFSMARRLRSLLDTIERAARMERRSALGDRWEMRRA